MKQNASLTRLLAIIGCACAATRQGQAAKRKITAFRLALDPRYLPVSHVRLHSRLGAVFLTHAAPSVFPVQLRLWQGIAAVNHAARLSTARGCGYIYGWVLQP